MDERHRSDSRNVLQSRGDSDTDDIDLSPLHESGMTQTFEGATRDRGSKAYPHAETEADIILIAHPENQRLGSRFRLSPGTTLEIGRSAAVGISLPEVMSISRKHARLRYLGPGGDPRGPGEHQRHLHQRPADPWPHGAAQRRPLPDRRRPLQVPPRAGRRERLPPGDLRAGGEGRPDRDLQQAEVRGGAAARVRPRRCATSGRCR